MRKIISRVGSLVVLTSLLICGTPSVVNAIETDDSSVALSYQNFEYRIEEDDTIVITDYYGLALDLEIPNEINGLPVRAIGKGAFSASSGVVNITIPENVTTIENEAFKQCKSIKTIKISDGVVSIGDEAFYDCTNLNEVDFGANVERIGRSAFENCSALACLFIPEKVKTIARETFENCSGLKQVYIGNVSSIGADAFYGCQIKSVFVDDIETWLNINMSTIGANPLSTGAKLYVGGELLTDLIVPETVTVIKSNSFMQYSQLKSITLHDGVTSIGTDAFYGCRIESVFVDDIETWLNVNLSSIGANPLSTRTKLYVGGELLTDLIVPETVTVIKSNSFMQYSQLKSVTLHDGVTGIGTSAFSGCQIESVCVDNIETWLNINFSSIGANPLSNGAKLYVDGELLTDLIVPETVTFIKNYSFEQYSQLKSVTLFFPIPSNGLRICKCSITQKHSVSSRSNRQSGSI